MTLTQSLQILVMANNEMSGNNLVNLGRFSRVLSTISGSPVQYL